MAEADHDRKHELNERRELARFLRTLRPGDPETELWYHAVARLLEDGNAPVLAFVDP
jgi:hypothetical protein